MKSPISHLCGFCGRDAWFEAVSSAENSGEQTIPYSHETESLVAALYRCSGCERCSIFYFGLGYDDLRLVLVLPSTRAQKNELLPNEIEADRQEAWNAYHAGLFRASILMARTTLQRAVRHLHEFRSKSLQAELDNLVQEQIINQQLRDNADELRITGNDVAHPEEMGEITKADAQDSLVFLDGFLDTTIAIPERQRRRKAARGE